jgi:hypothetical protein
MKGGGGSESLGRTTDRVFFGYTLRQMDVVSFHLGEALLLYISEK